MTNVQPSVGVRSYLRRNASARTSLMLGTALGCSILVAAATAPNQAWAADECGADVASVATCNADGVPATDANPYPTGIDYFADPAEDITVILTGAVHVVTATDDGVTATGVPDFDASIHMDSGSSIDTTQDGATVTSFGTGDAYFYAANGVNIDAGDRGIAVFAVGTGFATVVNYADITVDGVAVSNVSDGIVAESFGSDASIFNTGSIDVTGIAGDVYANGIYMFAAGAGTVTNLNDITVNSSAAVQTDGIIVNAASSVSIAQVGDINVDAATGYAVGILANTGGSAGVFVTGDTNVTGSTNDVYGIYVDAGTSAVVDVVGNVSTVQNSGLQNNFGIQVGQFPDPTGTTADVTVTGDVSVYGGAYAFGTYVVANGDINIDVNGTTTIGAAGQPAGTTVFGTGIYALNTGANAININAGDVYVYQDGSFLLGGGDGIAAYTLGVTHITADDILTTGYYADGVLSGGRLDIGGDTYVDVNSVRTYGLGSDGVDVGAHGDIHVTAGSIYTAGGNSDGMELHTDLGNIYSTSTSIVTVGDNAHGVIALADAGNASVTATDISVFGLGSDGIRIVTGGAGDAMVSINGDVYSADGFGVNVTSGDFSTISVASTGSVYGFDAGISSTSVSGTTITNRGDISGGAGMAIDVDGGSASLTNVSGGTIFGAVDLTDNADTFANAGTFEAYGTSNFGLGADVLTNTGVVGAERNSGAAGTVTFNGLETFNNAGGLVSMVDGQVGDRLVLNGTTFNGTGNSRLALDVALGGPGSTADVLQITGAGQFTGATTIQPNDLLAGSPGVLNFGGILVVDSSYASELGSEFNMTSIDKGFVEYSLIFDAATDNWLIVGLPDDEAFELLAVGQASGDFWRRSADAWTGRMQEVRDSRNAESPTRSEGWEFWMQAHGGDESFDNFGTFNVGGTTFAQNLSTDSDYRGLQIGADTVAGNFMWGLTGGFVQQETRFQADRNSLDFEGFNIGAYAGMNWGGLYLNGLVKGDFYTIDANFTSIPSFESLDGRTYGAQAEVGYRFDMGGMFIEPHAQIAWSSTDVDDGNAIGANFSFENNESLYGKAGARIGGTFGSGDMIVTPFVGVYAVEEFEGQNSLNFSTGPTSFNIQNEARGSYGQAELGVTTQSFYGLEAFAKGEWNFGGDASGGAFRLGARWRW